MRNCLYKCNRTQVRPATNEETEGIEAVASLLAGLTEAVREGRTRHFDDITDEGDPEDDEETVVEGDVVDVRLGRPDSQPEPELNTPTNPGRHITQYPIRNGARPSPRSRLQSAWTWRLDPVIAGFAFDQESMMEPRWKTPRRAEACGYSEPFRSPEASSPGLSPGECSLCRRHSYCRATLHSYVRGRTFGRLPDDDAPRWTLTMDPDKRGKNDDH